MLMKSLLGVIFLCGGASAVASDKPVEGAAVYRYFENLQAFHSDFTQRVTDGEGGLLQDSTGEVWIQRPGRFRWNYATPYQQQVVADGTELWTYDPELEQATVKPIGDVLATTPAMLLSGLKRLEDVATVEAIGRQAGAQWYRLIPLNPDESVERIHLVFSEEELQSIRVQDGLNNTTVIQFTNIQRNQPIGQHQFTIELPAGTDILGGN